MNTKLNENEIKKKFRNVNSIEGFYAGSGILITGATGFVGKGLLEKLIRTCSRISAIFVLIRPKRNQMIEQRFKKIIDDPIFDCVGAQNPTIFYKIHLVEGDVTLPNLGLSQKDRDMLIENVNIVFHIAATISFHQPLNTIVDANVKGTANIIKLCKELKHVISVVYVSTAYSNPNLSDIEEKVYTTNLDPSLVIDICDRQDKELINLLEERVLKTYPNTYTFSKNLAEQTISNNSKGLTVAIVRPSIISCSLKEPYPGWLVPFSGQAGIFVTIGKGIAKVLLGKRDVISDVVPIDYVVDVIMCAAWHVTLHINNEVKVYNCTSNARSIKLGEIIDTFLECTREKPMNDTLWYPSCTVVANRYVYNALNILLNVLPAFVIDIFLRLQGGKPMAMNMSKYYNKLVIATSYFNSNEWSFKRDNTTNMINKVNTLEDRNIVKLDLQDMDWKKYLADYLAGLKKFTLKEDTQSINTAQQRFYRIRQMTKGFGIIILFPIMLVIILLCTDYFNVMFSA
ncbi:fatty acyl-CoA reductase 1-like isoform X2 [Bombus pascuorum]|uniref:fatty acyl-CoA reductase 1-like isoform X2 n=1 Tax=Bombus pascuorum TaxID=65598 RepID=UPI00298D8137|nr:fatty acyl-CoA reductase 1-like isoform X2 [Bombus pascuorum]XP_060823531.1 fatty acyl-CoA reductase 1-like isoform X2 [Bombus pascuorum]XP_060823636.1 fatty acyl-CoA reductase 1-like isoform X2 [Bombus pascuorum]XP_060823640.1 fatty acyl-CoA reductase 1-like isoform X2 [Bombus pascuorum]